MAFITLIDNENAVRKWLETAPDQVRIWFAVRCGLRVLPALASERLDDTEAQVWPAFRILFFASLAAKTEISLELLHSRLKGSGTGIPVDLYIAGGSNRVAAADGINPTAGFLSQPSAHEAWSSYTSTITSHDGREQREELHHALRPAMLHDAQNKRHWGPLWPDQVIAVPFDRYWETALRVLAGKEDVWGFWLKWYQALLDGQPMDGKLQKKNRPGSVQNGLERRPGTRGRADQGN